MVLDRQISQVSDLKRSSEIRQVNDAIQQVQFLSPIKQRRLGKEDSKKRSSIKRRNFEEDFIEEFDELRPFEATDSNIEHLTRFNSQRAANPFLQLIDSKQTPEKSNLQNEEKLQQLEQVITQMFQVINQRVEPNLDSQTTMCLRSYKSLTVNLLKSLRK